MTSGSEVQPQAAPRSGTVPTEVLSRAEGVELIGEMKGSGYRVPPSLARRADGQTLQLTRLLYLTLEAIDGHRTHDEVAAVVSPRMGRTVTADNVRALVDQLRPLGVLTLADGTQPQLKRSDPLLGLRGRLVITDPTWTRRLTRPFGWLFSPVVVIPLLVAFAGVCWWVFMEKGLASATYEAFENPGLLLLVFGVTVLSAGFHEFGHAAAARYGGATPGVMGAAFYLVWPAFYTDVTDSYRLGKGGRLRTDLGGLYFNAIVAVAITGAWWLTRYDALLLVVATQILQMLRQLTPFVRFDGYHVLADLTGVPDLFHRIGPTLRSMLLPWRPDPEARLLKPWARVVITLWVLAVVPMLLFALAMMVLVLPRVLATAWDKLAREQDVLAAAWMDGEFVQAAARLLTMVAVALPVLASIYLVVRVARQAGGTLWRRTSGRPFRRGVAMLGVGALLAGLAWAWWPDGDTYEPIRPDDVGTLVNAFPTTSGTAAPTALAAPAVAFPQQIAAGASTGTLRTGWDTGQPLPTREEPRLALVVVPSAEQGTAPPAEDPTTAPEPDGWVFPFDRPLAPGPGDNQALAINTEDGTALYDVAVALVWATDPDQQVLNTNEAQAWASCKDCASVAVAYQVVLVVGNNPVIAPQNLAGALNYECTNCLTYALAHQLLVTLDGPLSEQAMTDLDTLWQEIADFAEDIEQVPLTELDARLDEYTQQIMAIIETDQPGTLSSSTTDGTSPTTEPSSTDSPTASPTTSGTTSGATSSEPSPTAEPSPSASSGSTSPSPTPTSSPTSAPADSPTASPTPTP